MGVVCTRVYEHIHASVKETWAHLAPCQAWASWLPCVLPRFDSLPSLPSRLPQPLPLPASFLPGGPAEWDLIMHCALTQTSLILLAPTESLGSGWEAESPRHLSWAWGHHRGSWAPKLALSRLISTNEPQILTGA